MNKPRLIDANKYKEYLIETASICEDLGMHELGMMNRNLAQMVDNIPTAYDIDDKVRQLEEVKGKYTVQAEECANRNPANGVRCNYNLAVVVGIDKAIEIVKGGQNE